MKYFLMTVFLLLTISACTNKDLYDSFQPDKSDCRKLPIPQREECNKRVDGQMSYDEYKKQRNNL